MNLFINIIMDTSKNIENKITVKIKILALCFLFFIRTKALILDTKLTTSQEQDQAFCLTEQ